MQSREAKVNVVCKTVSEFALEYRTTREKVIQQREKKATNRERKKTRGKMIVDVSLFWLGLYVKVQLGQVESQHIPVLISDKAICLPPGTVKDGVPEACFFFLDV